MDPRKEERTPRCVRLHCFKVVSWLLIASWLGVASAQPRIDGVNDRRLSSLDIVPGGLAIVRGEGLSIPGAGCFIPPDAWPLTAAGCGTTILLNGEPIPIGRVFERDGFNQITVQIPGDDPAGPKFSPGPAEFVVKVGEATSAPYATELKKFHPTLTGNFSVLGLDGLDFGEFRRTNGFLVTRESAAEPGETLTIAVDGIGPSTPFVPAGTVGPADPPAVANVTPTVLIQGPQKGASAVQVLSTTVSTTDVGLYDLTFVVPPNLPAFDNYSFSVQVEDGGTVYASRPVGLSVGQFQPEITGVLDGAGFDDVISPGSLVSVFGLFATKDFAAPGVPLDLQQDGFFVTFDGLMAGIFSINKLAGFDQANVHVPPNLDVTDGTVEVQVRRMEKGVFLSDTFEANAREASPGIYTFDSGVGRAIVQNVSLGNDDVINGSFAHAENSIGTAFGEQPAAVGGIITIWCNGLGPVNGTVETGEAPGLGSELLAPELPVNVIIGGFDSEILGTPVLHPTLVGTFQINVRVHEQVTPDPMTPLGITVHDSQGAALNTRGGIYIATRPKP